MSQGPPENEPPDDDQTRQFPQQSPEQADTPDQPWQPPAGEQPYGQPPPYPAPGQQPPYGQQPFEQQPYGQPTGGPPPYGPPPGQPGQPPYGPPPFAAPAPYGAGPHAPYGVHPATGVPYSDKQKLVAGILQLVVPLGVGRMYIGDVGIGVAQLLVTLFTCGLGALWPFIDGILILVSDDKTDAQGRPLRG